MALQNEDLLVIQREDTHYKLKVEELVTFTGVDTYLPLSGGTVAGEIIFTNINPFSFSPGSHTIEVDAFDIDNDTNVTSNYSSLNFRLGSSTDSEFK